MTRKYLALASLLVVAAMLAAALIVGSGLGDDVRLPVHWGVDGRADRFAGAWQALLMPAGMAACVSLIFFFLPSLEPRKQGLERSQGLYLWAWAAMLLMCAVIELVVIYAALGWDIAAHRLVVGGVGVMLALIGNQLGKSRSMYLVGIRTPWTLASEEVWIKTHRLGGKLMVGAGLIAIVAALLPLAPASRVTVLMVGVGAAALLPAAYSYLLWRRETRAQPSG